MGMSSSGGSQGESSGAAEQAGISTLDLMSASPAINRIVRLMLSRKKMTYGELCQAVDALPAEKQFSREELDESLAKLVEMAWLDRTEENGEAVYQVQMRPKVGTGDLPGSERLPKLDKPTERQVRKQGLVDRARALWNSLGKQDDNQK